MKAATIQRKCACGGACDSCKEKKEPRLQRSALSTMPSTGVPAAALDAMRGPGRPLDAATRASLEPRFGRSFAEVRVHDDAASARAATEIHAAAYTAGSHIVFGSGRYEPQTDRGRHLLAHELTHVAQQHSGAAMAEGIGAPDDAHEQEADRVADSIAGGGPPARVNMSGDRMIRRQAEDAEPAQAAATPAASAATPQRWIVEDDQQPAAGQMRRTEFLDALHPAICATADAEMARLGRSTAGCPVIERYQTFARARSAAQLESAARRYTAEAASVRSAREYIPIVARRVAQGIAEWGRSGVIPEIPPELGMAGLGKIRGSIGSVVSGLLGGVHFKARDGGANALGCPWLGLGGGRPLDSGVASRMEGALGASFSSVRIHTGSDAASAASGANARAFTIGRDIAFGAGEYQPGTPVGDALLAHELAHVAQQDGAPAGMMMKAEDTQSGALEEDADNAAAGAVVSIWGRSKQFARLSGARLKSGLRLSRCKTPQSQFTTANRQVAEACTADQRTTAGAGGQARSCCTESMLTELRELHPYALYRVERAMAGLAQPQTVREQLMHHFHVSPESPIVASILAYYQRMHARMTGAGVTFACRNQGEGGCNAPNSDECRADPSEQRLLTFCGNYDAGASGGTFLRQSREILMGQVIHEYAHLTCVRDTLAGHQQSENDILRNRFRPRIAGEPLSAEPIDEIAAGGQAGEGRLGLENYRYLNGPEGGESATYTGMTALQAVHQADAYKWFAMDAP